VTWVFSSLYNVIKPFLSGKTLEKIQLFSYDADVWKRTLLAQIPPESIPEEYGGTAPPILIPNKT
jgi:hypothetical protein